MTRLYVGNLAHDVTDAILKRAFSEFGEVTSARVVTNRAGRTKGFGYVEIADEAAAKAMEALRGTQLEGRTMDIVVEEPRARRKGGFRPRSGGRRRR
jgi:RNA recognition motif-containing protein